jgi:hypothetical protein
VAVAAADAETEAEADDNEDVPRKDARLGGSVTLPLLPPYHHALGSTRSL